MKSDIIYPLAEIPFIIFAVFVAFKMARAHRAGAYRKGMLFIAWGFVVMAIGHLHLQIEDIYGTNIFSQIFGKIGGRIAWISALIVTWSLAGYGFAKLASLSLMDGLTGVGNRRKFDQILEHETARARRDDSIISLIMIDIDCFKQFNDFHGHQKGDECLKDISQCLAASARRASDTVYRYGGEEFAIILPNTNIEEAKKLTEIVRSKVEKLNIPHPKSTVKTVTTISLGTSSILVKKSKKPVADLIKTADSALFEAKKNGRNQWVALPYE